MSLSPSSPLCKERERENSSHSEGSKRISLRFNHMEKTHKHKPYQTNITYLLFFLKGVDKKPYGSFSGPLKILSNVFAVPQAYPQACVMRTDVQRESPQTLQDFQSSNIQLCSLCSIY